MKRCRDDAAAATCLVKLKNVCSQTKVVKMNALTIAAFPCMRSVIALATLLVVATTLLLLPQAHGGADPKYVLMDKADQALDNVNTINFQQANNALKKIDGMNLKAANQAGALLGGILG